MIPKDKTKLNTFLPIALLLLLGIGIGLLIAPKRTIQSPTESTSPTKMKMDMATSVHTNPMVHFSAEALALSNIECTEVAPAQANLIMDLYGTVVANQNTIVAQPAHFGGRVDKLYVNYPGQTVTAGMPIAVLYSPELITALQEYLEAYSLVHSHPELAQAALKKLKEYKLSDEQIDRLKTDRQVSTEITMPATCSGIVVENRAVEGNYVKQGDPLFTVMNLSTVWVDFYVFDGQLPFISLNNTIQFRTDALPEQTFSGKVIFIAPTIDVATRTTTVRLACNNPNSMLKPQMYVKGALQASLPSTKDSTLIIPASAVLWTGTRSVVYVRMQGQPYEFMMRQVELGASVSDGFEVLSGLKAGEFIATQGVFCIDAEAQLQGKPNMLNPKGSSTHSGGMAGMKM